jgi:uncharacterized iron-regulated membrane protein
VNKAGNSQSFAALNGLAASGVFGKTVQQAIAQATATPPVDSGKAPPVLAAPTPPSFDSPKPQSGFMATVAQYKKPLLIGGAVLLVVALVLKFK